MKWVGHIGCCALLALAVSTPVDPAVADGGDEVAIAEVRFVDAVPSGPSVSERLEEIRRRIQQELAYPRLARLHRVEGKALVRFAIGRDGVAHDVAVSTSSGVPSLDRAAVRAVEAAAPLPWVYGRLEVPVGFALEEKR